jgi:hypothetical protein
MHRPASSSFVPPLHHGLYGESPQGPMASTPWQNLSNDLVLEEERTPSNNSGEPEEIQILEPVESDAFED